MKKLSLMVILILALLICMSSMTFADNRALLIAIDDYEGTSNDLQGCKNDMALIKEILINKIGLNSSHIKTLTDSSATKSNILNTIESWLVNGSKAGDVVFLFYSGHGSHVKDNNGDEPDGYDETIVASDGKNVLDDEIGKKIEKLKGRTVVVFFDSCYSGTATRVIGAPRNRIYKPEDEGTSKSFTRVDGTIIDKDINAYTVFLSACSPDETAKELQVEGVHMGAFTLSVFKGVMKHGANVTFKRLKNFASSYIHSDLGVKQNPTIEGSNTLTNKGLKDIFMTKPAEEIEEFEGETTTGAFNVKLWITEKGKTTFKVGDKLEFNVKSSKDGYLYLFDVQDGDEVVLLYPNKYSDGNRIRAGSTVSIPDKGSFTIDALKPGRDVVLAIVTTKPYADAESLIKPSFEDFKILSDGEMRSTVGMLRDLRALGVKPTGTEAGFEWSHDKVEIRVVK